MSTLLSLDALRAVVATDLDDAALLFIIDDEEAELVRRYGAHGDGATPTIATINGGLELLFLPRRAVSVSSVRERVYGGTYATVASTSYALSGAGQVTRIGALWAPQIEVTYVPADDRALRRRVLIELVRIALEQTGYTSVSVAGVSSVSAPNWEERRASLYRRLSYMSL